MDKQVKVINKHVGGGGGAVYGLGLIGALVYYFQQANTFVDFIWAIIKSLFWPAFLIYELLGFLGM